jgi:cell division protein FtsB
MEKKTENWLKLKIGKISGYALILLAILLAVSTVGNFQKARRVRSDIQAEKDKIAKIKAENDELERQLAEIQGSDFIEKEVRNKLGLAKEGEAIVVLPDEATLKRLAPQNLNEGDTLPDPNWKKWEKLFF